MAGFIVQAEIGLQQMALAARELKSLCSERCL